MATLLANTLGTAFIPQTGPDGTIYLWPTFEWGETPSGICLGLEVRGNAGSVSPNGHPDGWFAINNWEGKLLGFFIPEEILNGATGAVLETSIGKLMYPGKKVHLIANYNVVVLS